MEHVIEHVIYQVSMWHVNTDRGKETKEINHLLNILLKTLQIQSNEHLVILSWKGGENKGKQ